MMSYSMRRLCVVVDSQSHQYRESVILWFPHGVDRYVIAWLNCSFAKIFCASQTTVFSFADCTFEKATLDDGKLHGSGSSFSEL